jgi:hypothetical protein
LFNKLSFLVNLKVYLISFMSWHSDC